MHQKSAGIQPCASYLRSQGLTNQQKPPVADFEKTKRGGTLAFGTG